MTEFWSLDHMRPAIPWSDDAAPAHDPRPPPGDPRNSSSYFLVADYCITALAYSIRLTPDLGAGNPMVIGPHASEDDHTPLAESFTDFIELYLDDPEALVGG